MAYRRHVILAAMQRLPVLILLSLTTVAAIAAKSPAAVQDVDRIIAVVNNDVITAVELATRVADTKKQLAIERIKMPPDEVLRKQLLERMILEHVQLQLAAQSGIRVSDSEVEKAIETIARRNNMGPDALYRMLAREGLEPEAYRRQIQTQITIQQLMEREIGSRVTVTESEVTNFLQNAQSRGAARQEYRLAHIFLSVPESASTEQIQAARARAEGVHTQLKAGADFAQAAVTHSQGPDAMKGGSLDWKKAGQLPELFLKALDAMGPGDISGVLRGPNGFHILKLHDVRGAAAAEAVTQTRVRHILLRPSEIQSAAEAQERLRQLRARIKNGDDFAALARAHSEDTASATGGGDLGWVGPKQLVPEFETAMNVLKPNDISAPVKTPFGFHIIQVLERRRADVSEERARTAARRQIHARKADDRLEQWARQLRDEAYVEYHLEEE